MKQRKQTISGYDKTCREYADQFMDELSKKHLDRILLSSFAAQFGNKGPMLDLACGPGQTTQFMRRQGVKEITGLDLSPGMIEIASQLGGGEMEFVVGDMLDLQFDDQSFGSAICFYGIVHFLPAELQQALREIYRVMQTGGHFLFSFHLGTGSKVVEEFLGKNVDPMEFYFFELEPVLELLAEVGWETVEVLQRHPYPEVEFPSQRAYITVRKPV